MLRYDIIEKECELSFHMIYYLCFYVFSIQSYADWKKLYIEVLNLCKTRAKTMSTPRLRSQKKVDFLPSNWCTSDVSNIYE